MTTLRPSATGDIDLTGVPCVVTGGAGFVGSHLCRALADAGAQVRALDDLSGGRRSNLDGCEVSLIEGSILDPDALADAMDGAALVFHLAAMVSVPESVADPERCAMVNVVGSQRVLDAAVRAGARRFVFAGSAAAYGGEPILPSVETQPVEAWSPYAASKIAGEQFTAAAARTGAISTVSLRFFNIYGPRQDPRSPYAAAICAFIDRVRRGTTITIFGDGRQTRDFISVHDVVRANLLAATTPRPLAGEIINIGTGHAATLLEVVSLLQCAAGAGVPIEHGPARAGDVRHSVASIDRARQLLGFEPRVPLSEGLAETLHWSLEAPP